MHMHMYHEYESVYEYGSNAFELTWDAHEDMNNSRLHFYTVCKIRPK